MAQKRTGYPSDVSDEEWALCAPYLGLMREAAPQRIYPLRSVFNAVRYLVKSGCGWRMLPNDLPPWPVVHQQTQRWIEAKRFEIMAHDLREVLRVAAGREEAPTAAILDSRTVQSTPSSGARAGYDGAKLTLNALANACNQLTNRDPVVAYDDQIVLRALDGLREKRLASLYHGADSRVPRYKHTLADEILLTPAETALLCVLMLRGPQTVGELRTRSERLFPFDNLAEVEEVLTVLGSRDPQPLVTKLPRQPGTKESRIAQLLSGPIDLAAAAETPSTPPPATPAGPTDRERLAQLEQETAALRREFGELRDQFATFKKQFE